MARHSYNGVAGRLHRKNVLPHRETMPLSSRRTALAALAVFSLAPACITDNRTPRDRGTGIFENTQTIEGPTQVRCDKYAKGSKLRGPCDDARYLADTYVRRLSSGDDVCLEGGFGEEANRGCLTRATVMDTAPAKVLLEINEAKPHSRWFSKEHHQYWFEERALVDLYLSERGY